MFNNPYQSIPEPSNKEVWYDSSIVSIDIDNQPNTKLDRYKHKLRLSSTVGYRMIEFTRKSQIYIDPSSEDEYFYVDPAYKFRPDLISQQVYGTPVLYWVILSCNNMKHPLELITGLTVRIPPLQSIIHDWGIM